MDQRAETPDGFHGDQGLVTFTDNLFWIKRIKIVRNFGEKTVRLLKLMKGPNK